MNKNTNILYKIAFKTQSYRKNYDLTNDNDHIITEHTGIISHLRIEDAKPPLLVGEYAFSVWNLLLAKTLNINPNTLIKSYKHEEFYQELIKLIKSKKINIEKYDKIILIQDLIIKPEYRKIGITQEFTEFIYRDFYGENIGIIALVKPIQENMLNYENYFNKSIKVFDDILDNYHNVPAKDYFSLEQLNEKKDYELNSYKLFSVASKCGFKRIDESYLFQFEPDIIIEKIKYKYQNNH